jgi:hypothetical protein
MRRFSLAKGMAMEHLMRGLFSMIVAPSEGEDNLIHSEPNSSGLVCAYVVILKKRRMTKIIGIGFMSFRCTVHPYNISNDNKRKANPQQRWHFY